MKRKIVLLLSVLLLLSFIANAQEIHPVIHKPKHGNIYVIAHRGYHKYIPENTITAYKKSIDIGCDFIEIDIRQTKDNKFVSIHNSTIDAYVPGKTGRVNEMTLRELKALDIGSKFGADYKNECIPTLEEILILCKDKIGIYLDLKDGDIEAAYYEIKKHGMLSQVVWYVPAKILPQIIATKNKFEGILLMPDPGTDPNIYELLQINDLQFVASDIRSISGNLVQQAHANNIKVLVDDRDGGSDEWKYLMDLDVDGIQTDSPIQLIEFLEKQSKSRNHANPELKDKIQESDRQFF